MKTDLATVAERASSELIPIEYRFTTHDGVELFYRAWLPFGRCERAVILLHRGHEHADRWEQVVSGMNLPGTAFFAWDARGHGRSPGACGGAKHVAELVKDLDCFARHLSGYYDVSLEQTAVVAHSVGAVIAAAWVHDYSPPLRALVLAAPAFRVKLYVPFAVPALRWLRLLRHDCTISSYVTGQWLTHDVREAQRYDKDPLISRSISVNVLLDLFDTATRLIDDAGTIQVPTLVIAARADRVVERDAATEFFKNLGSPGKAWCDLDGFRHSIFHEERRDQSIEKVRQFLESAFLSDRLLPNLLNADVHGFTRSECERLLRPLPSSSFRRLKYSVQRLAMRTAGRLSRGIQIGWSTGFDSGESLDYIYESRPRGVTPVGRWIDAMYLKSIGWRGIRARKANVQRLLRRALEEAREDRRQPRIVDIAAGAGRYVLEVLREPGHADIPALLRDRSATALEQGRRAAEAAGLRHVRFEEGDAFDPDSLARITPAANIAVVSGLYELFPRNDCVLQSLTGLNRALEDGGWLIYTNQPWHPQIEMIARVLVNRDGQPWVMRRRTQAELDQLVAAAGFEKVEMAIDEFGIFTVALARKTRSV